MKAIIFNEQQLNKVNPIQELCDFLTQNFSNLIERFNLDCYPATKQELERLQNVRAEQLFPGLKKGK